MLLFKQITLLILTATFIKTNLAQDGSSKECNDSCNGNNTDRTCFCSECDFYKDCCNDNEDSSRKQDLSTYYANCNLRISNYEYTHSIATCLTGWMKSGSKNSKSIRNNCEYPAESKGEQKVISHIPVFSRETNLTYRNIYCAKCNIPALNMETIAFFKYQPSLGDITDNPNFTRIILENQEPIFKLDSDLDISLRKCIPAVDTCLDKDSSDLKDQCQNHTAYVKSRTSLLVYKNKYCAYCNNVSDTDLECYPIRSRDFPGMFTARTNLGILIDISSLGLREIMMSQLFDSDDDEIGSNYPIITIKPSSNDNSTSVSNQVKKYLTMSGLFVSIISIIALLVIYCTNEALRNFPGKLLICLSMSILCSQLAFLVSSYITKPMTELNENITVNEFKCPKQIVTEMFKPCYVFGMLMHFFYLATFTWSNVMGFDLYRMFAVLMSSSRADDQEQREKRFKKYSIYGWLVPLTVVLSLVIKQFMTTKLSYGFDKCYITETVDILTFFLAPIALILFVNLMFLGLTIRSIAKVDKMTRRVFLKDKSSKAEEETLTDANSSKLSHLKRIFGQKMTSSQATDASRGEKKRFLLFIKLFFLTGMTWVLGLLTASYKDSILWYFYILFNSLQGFFIFLSFAFNTQTRRELKKSSVYRTFSSVMNKKSDGSSDESRTSTQDTKLTRVSKK